MTVGRHHALQYPDRPGRTVVLHERPAREGLPERGARAPPSTAPAGHARRSSPPRRGPPWRPARSPLHMHPRDDEGRETLAASHVEGGAGGRPGGLPGSARRREHRTLDRGRGSRAAAAAGGRVGRAGRQARLRVAQPVRGGSRRPGRLPARGGRGRGGRAREPRPTPSCWRPASSTAELVRVLVEPQEPEGTEAVRTAAAIDAALDAGGVQGERFHHGYGAGHVGCDRARRPSAGAACAPGSRTRRRSRTGPAPRATPSWWRPPWRCWSRLERSARAGGARHREPGRGARRALGARAPAGARGGGRAASRRPLPPLRAASARGRGGGAARAGRGRGDARARRRQRRLVPGRDRHQRPGGRLPRRGGGARGLRQRRRGGGRRVRPARARGGRGRPARGHRALGVRQREPVLRLADGRLPDGARRPARWSRDWSCSRARTWRSWTPGPCRACAARAATTSPWTACRCRCRARRR